MRAWLTMLLAACADPAPPVPPYICPVGLCEARVRLGFAERWLQVEVGGVLFDEHTTLYGPDGPLALRIYGVDGVVWDCTVPIAGDVALQIIPEAGVPRLLSGEEMPCEWRAGGPDVRVERVSERSVLRYGDDACTDCEPDRQFIGPLTVGGRMGLTGARRAAYCAKWEEGGDFALVVDGDVRVTWTAAGPCPGLHPWSHEISRLPPVPSAFVTQRPGPDATTRRWPALAVPEPPPPPGIGDVGAWIGARYPDPFARAKAVHDAVARGGPAFAADRMVAMGRAAGLEVVRVDGEGLGERAGPHAWNAVRIGQSWYLVDAAWDAAPYGTRWLFTPPEIFLATHLPADPAWQLVSRPWTAGAARARPHFGAGVVLLSPRKRRISNAGRVVHLRGHGLAGAVVRDREEVAVARCERADGRLECPIPGTGTFTISLFAPGSIYAGELVVRRD